MIFAPLMTRRASSAPRPSDVALQRFLLGTLANSASARPADYTVTQDDKATTLQLDVPGLARDQLQITIEGKQVRLQSLESAPRQVRRAWELPEDIDASTSTAKLENGVLTLTLVRLVPADKAVQLVVH